MPVNRNALIRYKTIDKCLQNRYRKWTLDDLIEACSDALYEYEGIDKGVSKRTVQGDIQIMRSDKLGYNAPIVVLEKKYYTYEDSNYSITNIPLTDQDLGMLTEAVAFMKQFKGFSHFRELDGMVQKLEDHIYSQKTQTQPVIDFEKNDNLKGLEYLDQRYQAIIKQQTLYITYQSFKARTPNSFDFHPYLLKEFRNRWFLIGVKEGAKGILNLALDRIVSIEPSTILYKESSTFDATTYFNNAIGVSVSPNAPTQEILLYVNRFHAPYILTKPLHHSQKVVEEDYYGITISLQVQQNFELEKAILGFGDGMKVLAPVRLKRVIKNRLSACLDWYNTEVTDKGLSVAAKKLHHRGFALLNYIYTQREIKAIGKLIHQTYGEVEEQHQLLQTNPALFHSIFNKNLRRLIQKIVPHAFLVKSTYYHRAPQTTTYQNWHQGGHMNVQNEQQKTNIALADDIAQNVFCLWICLDDINSSNGTIQLLPGSHKKRLSPEAIELITSNSLASIPELYAGSILMSKPLLLLSSPLPNKNKRRRIIRLEFTATQLPSPYQWLEKIEL